jgi:hypothetical protein
MKIVSKTVKIAQFGDQKTYILWHTMEGSSPTIFPYIAERIKQMDEHNDVAYDKLLKIWQFRRELFNRYSHALRMLMVDKGAKWQEQHELREQLAQAEQELRKVSEQIYAYELAAP